MLVPQSRLLFWFAVVVLPFSALAALYPEASLLPMLLIAALLLLAALDAVLAYGSLDGISLKLPEVVRLSKDRAGKIDIKVKNTRQKGQRVRVGLPLPREIQSPNEDIQITLPTGSEWSRLDWPCRPLQRGNYLLNRTYLEGASPLGFWALRASAPAHSELRVYPNLFTERKDLAAIFLHRGTFGLHAQRQVGKGRDFEKLREYVPGDSYDEIHWKATAKRGHPVTKVFQIERTQEIYVIIDASRLSARNVGGSTASLRSGGSEVHGQRSVNGKPLPAQMTQDHAPRTTDTSLERFITAALVLGLAAEQQGDLFGLLAFTDKVDTFVRAKNGQAHYNTCRDSLYTLQPKIVTPDFDEVAAFIRLRLRRRALLVFLTALDDPVLAESFVRNMALLCRQHLVLVNMLSPPGALPLFSNPTVDSLNDLYGELGGHVQWHNLRELEKVLERRGVRFSLLEDERLCAQLVTQYLSVKQRQLL